MRTIIAAAAFGLTCTAALADDNDACRGALPPLPAKFSGVVSWIGDGDMLCIGPDRDRRIEVRIADFNAPELNKPGGTNARDVLKGIALNKFVECTGNRYSLTASSLDARSTVEALAISCARRACRKMGTRA